MKKYTIILIGFVIATTVAAIVVMSSIDEGKVPSFAVSMESEPAVAPQSEARPTEMPFPELHRSNTANSVKILETAERSAEGDPAHDEVDSLLLSGDARKQLLAIDLMYDFDDDTMLPFLHLALESETEQVRVAAVALAGELEDDDQRAEILERAVSDHSPFVGYAVLDEVDEQPKAIREKVFRSALKLAPAEIAGAVVGELEVDSDYGAVELIIEGLDSTVEATRNEASLALEFIFEEEFASARQAQNWWQQNRDKYDRDLVEKF
jgi:hypothetical protein